MTNKYVFQCYLIKDQPHSEASLRIGDLFASKGAAEAAGKAFLVNSQFAAEWFNRIDVVRVKVSYAKWAAVFVKQSS